METIQLIKGKFTPEEAKEILLNLVNSKIRFHELRNFSSVVCSNKPDTASEKRIAELKEAREQIKACIQQAKEDNSHLMLEGTIQVTFQPEETPLYTESLNA